MTRMSNSGQGCCVVEEEEEVEEMEEDDNDEDDENDFEDAASARARALKSSSASCRVGILSTRATRATCFDFVCWGVEKRRRVLLVEEVEKREREREKKARLDGTKRNEKNECPRSFSLLFRRVLACISIRRLVEREGSLRDKALRHRAKEL